MSIARCTQRQVHINRNSTRQQVLRSQLHSEAGSVHRDCVQNRCPVPSNFGTVDGTRRRFRNSPEFRDVIVGDFPRNAQRHTYDLTGLLPFKTITSDNPWMGSTDNLTGLQPSNFRFEFIFEAIFGEAFEF